jgi:hypothetical protein
MAEAPRRCAYGAWQEVKTIPLTSEQKAEIEQSTGVSLNELTVLKLSGSGARELSPALVQGHAVVCCW